MPVTRSRAKQRESEASSLDVTKTAPTTSKTRSKITIKTVSSSTVSDYEPQSTIGHPIRKPLKSLPKKDCELLASILNEKLFDKNDEIPNLLMEMKDSIQKKLESTSSFTDSQNNNDTKAVQTPLMKNFLSRCPRIRDDVTTTQRPSVIRESSESTNQVNGNRLTPNDASKHKKKRKKPRVSYKIPHKSPRPMHRLSRSRSKAKPKELKFGSSTCSTLSSSKETETDESQTTISTINATVNSVSTKREATDLRLDTHSRKENKPNEDILPPLNQSQNTKKRKPEFTQLQTDGLTVPQSFDFGYESLQCAAKKRILDLPSGLPPHPPKLQPIVRLERLGSKEINSHINPQRPQQQKIIQENPLSSLTGAGDMELNKKDDLEPSQPLSTSVRLISTKSKRGSADVSSKDHRNNNQTLEKNVNDTSSSSSKKCSTNVPPASIAPNSTFNIQQQQPNSGKNLDGAYNVEPNPITDATFVRSQPKSNSTANETYNIQSSFRAKQNLETTYNVDSCPPADATFVTAQPNSAAENATYDLKKKNKVVVPLDKIQASETVGSPSAKLVTVVKSKSAALIHTPVEIQKTGEKKQSATKLVRSSSSNTDLLQKRRENKLGDFSTTPTSSTKFVKMGDKMTTTTMHPPSALEKGSEGQRQADKLTDTERIKKIEEKQDKYLSKKEEILQQKKEMQKKKNEEWKAKMEKIREEEEKRKAEDEKRRADEIARKEQEDRRKRRADELAKKEAEVQAKLDNKAKPAVPVSTFSVKAAIQALITKTTSQQADRGQPQTPAPAKLVPKHLQPSDKGATSSCPDIPKKCGPPPSAHHTEKLQFPGLKSKPISGSACQLASKDGGLTESVIATSSWKPFGKNVESGDPPQPLSKPQPPPLFKQPQPPPSAWKNKSPTVKLPVVPLVPHVPNMVNPIDDSLNGDESFVTVADTTFDAGHRDTYDITIYDNIDENLGHRDGKYIPPWAADGDKLHLSLFLQQPNLIELMQTKCFPNKNTGFQLFPKPGKR